MLVGVHLGNRGDRAPNPPWIAAEESLCRYVLDRPQLMVADPRPPNIHSLRDRLTEVMVEASDNDDVTVLLLRRSAGCPGGGAARVADIDLPQRLTSAGTARRFVSERLEDWGAQDVRDAVLLCVSEVVTNAVVHAGSPAHLSLRMSGGVLRVEVQDCGGIAIPQLRREATPEQTHGRGLVLVEAMSDRWDVVDEVDGKQVWFEVAVPGA